MSGPDIERLAAVVAEAAVAMPDAHLQVLAERIARHPTAASARSLTREPPVVQYTEAASRIIDAWEDLPPGVDGAIVSAMLQTARVTRRRTADLQRVRLAWTGPDSAAIKAKPTSHVVTDVIDGAERQLLLVSYATHRVERIHSALGRAADRGVDISLVVETEQAANGQYRSFGPDPFEGIRATKYVWDTAARPVHGNRVAVLHAKIVLADSRVAFVTSANLTGRALDDNIEAGVVITGGPIPVDIYNHFRELAYAGILVVV